VTPAGDTIRPHLGAFARFFVLGVGSLALNLVIVTFMSEMLETSAAVAGACGYAIVFVVNFALARRYVFESSAAIVPEATRFAIVQLVTRCGEYGAYLGLTYLLGVHYFAAVLIVGIVFFIVKFGIYRFLVFRAEPVDQA